MGIEHDLYENHQGVRGRLYLNLWPPAVPAVFWAGCFSAFLVPPRAFLTLKAEEGVHTNNAPWTGPMID